MVFCAVPHDAGSIPPNLREALNKLQPPMRAKFEPKTTSHGLRLPAAAPWAAANM